MKRYLILTFIIFGFFSVFFMAQQGQNQPIYDPNDPIGRVLPPNLSVILDTSGSMNWPPRGYNNYGRWIGTDTRAKIGIAKDALYTLWSVNSLSLRWAFWVYDDGMFKYKYNNGNNWSLAKHFSSSYFPYSLYRYRGYRYIEGRYRRYYDDPWIFHYSGCVSTSPYGRNLNDAPYHLLVDLPMDYDNPDSTDLNDEQWFAASTTPGYDNRGEMKLWIDRDGDIYSTDPSHSHSAVAIKGTHPFPFDHKTYWSSYYDTHLFFKEIGAAGNTPIANSLKAVLYFNTYNGFKFCDFREDPNSPVDEFLHHQMYGLTSRTPEKNRDPYFDCRYNAVLVLTDGMETCGGSPVSAASQLHQNGVDVFVVGFGMQSDSQKRALDRIASAGGTDHAYFADNTTELINALRQVLTKLGGEISGDTEPVLGFIKPDAITWPLSMPDDVQVQNIVINASMTFSPTFSGHLRCFQAITTYPADSSKIKFLHHFDKNNTDGNLLWDAYEKIRTMDKDNRKVYTSTYAPGTLFRFDLSHVIQIKQITGIADTNEARDFIRYIRNQDLGDITYSTPAFVGPPNPNAYRTYDYIQWANSLEDRKPVVLVGANDGMLHCIDATNGEELWAYIPYDFLRARSGHNGCKLFEELYGEGDQNNQGQPNIYGERVYGRRPHYFYIASPIRVEDVKDLSGNWHTICVFGLGAGGDAYYALDITDVEHPFFLWRYKGDSSYPLGETWSIPAICRIADSTGNYPLGRFVVAFGSGFNLNPEWSNPQRRGKSFYVIDALTGQKIYRYTLNDATQTIFSGTQIQQVGNCIFTPIVAYDDPDDSDDYVNAFYFGTYRGNVYRISLNGTSTSNWDVTKIFESTQHTPIYSPIYVNKFEIRNAGKKTLIAFSEYGSPIDTVEFGGSRKPGILYCLVEENLGNGTVSTNQLVNINSSSFSAASDKGFYYRLPSPQEGESCPFGPRVFFDRDTGDVFMAATSYLFFPNAGMAGNCDPVTHTVNAGRSKAYIIDIENGDFLDNGAVDLGSGTTYFGRASAFHKGARGEAWTDIGTGEVWGWGYKKTGGTKSFKKFGDVPGNDIGEKNPTGGITTKTSYWRIFQ